MTAELLLRFVHISDTHVNFDRTYQTPSSRYTPMVGVEALIEAVNALPFTPDFILHTGDVAYDPHPELYAQIREVFSALKAPIYYLAGNHDHNRSVQSILMGRSEAELEDHFHDEFEVNGVQILCVDSNQFTLDEAPAGRVPAEQLDWLHEKCTADDDRPLIIATHHNVVPYGVPWLDDWMRTLNGLDFHEAIKPATRRLRGVFHGHIHQNISAYYDGILYTAAASPWDAFQGYPIPENISVIPDHDYAPGFSVVAIGQQHTFIRRHGFRIPGL